MRAAERAAPARDHEDADAVHREAWGLLTRLFMADKSRRFQALATLGLTPMQGQVLMLLSPDEPLPMSALAERMQCDNSNITGIADRLEALGIVERRPAARDRRVKTLALTAAGEALRRGVEDEVGRPPAGIAALDARDAARLRDVLARAIAAQPGA